MPYSRTMRTALSLALAIPGVILLGTQALPLGLLMIYAGVRVSENRRIPDGDGLTHTMLTLGALGALTVIVQFIAQRF